MALTGASYAHQLLQLLPRGPLWQINPSGDFAGLLRAIGESLARSHGAIERLLLEADPRTTGDLLAEWEAACGLPDGCIPGGGTTEQRRAAVVARLIATGGANAAYFIALAATYGYTLTVDELATNQVRFNSDLMVAVTPFRAGLSHAGEPLRAYGNDQLDCLIDRIKPAHVVATIAYPES